MSGKTSEIGNPSEDTLVQRPAPAFAEAFFAPASVALPVAFGAASHVGKVRSQNEDHYAIFRQQRTTEFLLASIDPHQLATANPTSYGMVVADGMGGMQTGELASRMALQTMLELSGQATSWVMRFTNVDAQQITQRVEAYVQRIQAALCQHGQLHPDSANMATTWTSIHLLDRHAVVVHLGDSRAYVHRGGHLRQITRDETVAQSLIDLGHNVEEAKKFNHIVLNSFGGGGEQAPHASIHHLEFVPGDQFLLCSDGLTSMVTDDQIAAELGQHRSPQAACNGLVQRALDGGGKDNVTVLLAFIGSEGLTKTDNPP